MKIEIDTKNNLNIEAGCIIITDNADIFLVTESDLNTPCACSESMGEGYVLIKLNTMQAWAVYANVEEITSDLNVIKIIQPENILLKEI